MANDRLYICGKCVFKHGNMFSFRVVALDEDDYYYQLFKMYHSALINYKEQGLIFDELLYVEIEEPTTSGNEICYPLDECHELHGTDCPAWKCSVCGDEFPAESNYCSNCGSRIDKEKIKHIPDI